MAQILYYPTCGTCRKALKWLDENGIIANRRHIVENRPTEVELADWVVRSGLPTSKFFNTTGRVYRENGIKEVVKIATNEELIRLLASDGMLLKRPILVTEDAVLVGFKEVEWQAQLLKK